MCEGQQFSAMFECGTKIVTLERYHLGIFKRSITMTILGFHSTSMISL